MSYDTAQRVYFVSNVNGTIGIKDVSAADLGPPIVACGDLHQTGN